jgi:23S rRNA (uracil1939-C5)-methyltransferase
LTREVGAELELAIERLAAGGDGVAHSDGLTVFVPRSAPGDRVRARVTKLMPRFARAEIAELYEPGPARREAPCPYYGRCGGCSWLHLDEAEQLRARVSIARDALERLAGRTNLPEIEVVASPRALGYRARARVAYAKGRIGFRARGSHEIVDVERCAMLDPETERALLRLRANRPRGAGEVEIRGVDPTLEVSGVRLELGTQGFFQANRALWERWLESVLAICGRGERAVELYCGAGFYTARLTRQFARVVALEGSADAARLARRNSSAEIVAVAAEDWVPSHLAAEKPELVLLNPPRSGVHPAVAEAIGSSAAQRVVYVSCDPSTLARDLVRMGEGFRVARLVLLDALPQTHHVELVVGLERIDIALRR